MQKNHFPTSKAHFFELFQYFTFFPSGSRGGSGLLVGRVTPTCWIIFWAVQIWKKILLALLSCGPSRCDKSIIGIFIILWAVQIWQRATLALQILTKTPDLRKETIALTVLAVHLNLDHWRLKYTEVQSQQMTFTQSPLYWATILRFLPTICTVHLNSPHIQCMNVVILHATRQRWIQQ